MKMICNQKINWSLENLPYNISSKILMQMDLKLNKNTWFQYLILLFQKELADRILNTILQNMVDYLS